MVQGRISRDAASMVLDSEYRTNLITELELTEHTTDILDTLVSNYGVMRVALKTKQGFSKSQEKEWTNSTLAGAKAIVLIVDGRNDKRSSQWHAKHYFDRADTIYKEYTGIPLTTLEQLAKKAK